MINKKIDQASDPIPAKQVAYVDFIAALAVLHAVCVVLAQSERIH